jgi:hypothetical protein
MFGFIAISWALSFGLVPLQTDNVQKSSVVIEKCATFAELEVSAIAWDCLRVFGSVETYQFFQGENFTFSPYRADYIFGAEFIFNENIRIGVDHECDHPVASGAYLNTGIYESSYNYLSGETRVYIKIGATVKE